MRNTTRSTGLVVALVMAMTMTVAGCGGGSSDSGSPSDGPKTTGPKVDPTECGTADLAKATKPVEITFWHTMVRSNLDWLVDATKRFNASQKDVHVTLRAQPSYQDTFTKYKAGLQSGDLPDLVQMEETTVQQMIDSRSTVPAQACIDATKYATDDFVPRALAYYSYGGVQQSMPWAVSNPILFFDPGKFVKAGLDPAKPPKTLAEVKEYSQKLVSSGAAKHGIALRIEPYIFEFLLAKSGGSYVNNGNGHDKRATEANLTSPEAQKIWAWWKDMVDSGLAIDAGSEPGGINHLLAIGTGDAAMTFEGSGAIGPVEAVLAGGQYPGVTVGTAPLPALTDGGGVPVGDGSLWLSKKSAPEKRAAAWTFVEFLVSPEEQAGLAVAGGYAPIRISATKLPSLMKQWADQPNYRAGYDQLVSGTPSVANSGSLIGYYQGVRDAVRDGLTKMLRDGATPEAATASAKKAADSAIQEYNSRVGG